MCGSVYPCACVFALLGVSACVCRSMHEHVRGGGVFVWVCVCPSVCFSTGSGRAGSLVTKTAHVARASHCRGMSPSGGPFDKAGFPT